MALVQLDLITGSGDQLLTLDTETSLEWLNLTVTANRSYTEIQAGFGSFIGTYGFQYAEPGQVRTLLQHAGINEGIVPPANLLRQHNGMQTIQALMNGRVLLLSGSGGIVKTLGITKPVMGPVVHPDGCTMFLSLTDPAASQVDFGPLASPSVTITSASPEVCSYLVRSAP